jgi:hypothetical protein
LVVIVCRSSDFALKERVIERNRNRIAPFLSIQIAVILEGALFVFRFCFLRLGVVKVLWR